MNRYMIDSTAITHPKLVPSVTSLCEEGNEIVLTTLIVEMMEKMLKEGGDSHKNASSLIQMATEENPNSFIIDFVSKDRFLDSFDSFIDYCRETKSGVITSNSLHALKAKAYQIPVCFLKEEQPVEEISSDTTTTTEVSYTPKETIHHFKKTKTTEVDKEQYIVTDLPGGMFVAKRHELMIKTGWRKDGVAILYYNGNHENREEDGKLVKANVGDVVRILTIKDTTYYLDDYYVIKIGEANNCLKKHLAEGHNGKREFDATEVEEFDEILKEYLN